jgi:hypothetical protein
MWSGGVRVQISASPWRVVATGVGTDIALLPSAATTLESTTGTTCVPTERVSDVTSEARVQLPAEGKSTSAEYTPTASGLRGEWSCVLS